jgi:hypothetical protein
MSAYPSILLQKSFWGDERKFLEPLMHFARGDVRDHVVSSKINHFLVALKSDAATETSKNRLSRDFWGLIDFRLLQQYHLNNRHSKV